MDITRNGFNSVEGISPVREVDIQGYPACHWLTTIVILGWSFPRVMLLTTGPKLDFFFSQSVERDAGEYGVGRNGTLSLCPISLRTRSYPEDRGCVVTSSCLIGETMTASSTNVPVPRGRILCSLGCPAQSSPGGGQRTQCGLSPAPLLPGLGYEGEQD